jgi:anti-anti-sigma regulatory factor
VIHPSTDNRSEAQPIKDEFGNASELAGRSTPIATKPSESQLFELEFDPARGLVLRGEVTIRTAGLLYARLKQIDIDPDEFLFLDLSGLTQLDTAGAQLLLAFKRSRPNLAVHSCPDMARRFIELTGLTCILTS